MIELSFTTNLESLMKGFKEFRADQLPFAMSQTMNSAIKGVRKRIVQKSWPQSVEVRNKRFMTAALRMEFAKKRNLTVRLYDKLGRDYLERLTSGGRKTGQQHRLAIPASGGPKRTASGRIPKARKPRQILNQKKSFIVKTKRGTEIIATRKGPKKNTKIVPQYILKKSAQIKKQFDFYEDAKQTFSQKISRDFRFYYGRSLRSSFRRNQHGKFS